MDATESGYVWLKCGAITKASPAPHGPNASPDQGMSILRHAVVLTCLLWMPLKSLSAPLAGPITNAANSHVYYLLAASDWTTSKEEARQLGGELATINDAAEQAWVYGTFSSYGGVKRHLWIGLYDPNSTQNAVSRVERMREFRWISGEASTFQNWSSTEPSHSSGNEQCVMIWSPNDPNAGRWNDANWTLTNLLSDPLHGVVEVDPSFRLPPVNPAEPAEVLVTARPTKIEQLVGDFDRERQPPTRSQTATKYALPMTDLGVPFLHDGKTYIAFGDVPAAEDRDPMAWTTDANLDDGLDLQFIAGSSGKWQPISIPGVTLRTLEVPVEGISLDNQIYLWATTDHSPMIEMGRSVLARSSDNALSWRLLRTFSERHFINVSAVVTPAGDWPGTPDCSGQALFVFGAGEYRKSNVRLAWLPGTGIEKANSIRYFAGLTDRHLLFRGGWSLPDRGVPFKAKRGRNVPCGVRGRPIGAGGRPPTSPDRLSARGQFLILILTHVRRRIAPSCHGPQVESPISRRHLSRHESRRPAGADFPG